MLVTNLILQLLLLLLLYLIAYFVEGDKKKISFCESLRQWKKKKTLEEKRDTVSFIIEMNR